MVIRGIILAIKYYRIYRKGETLATVVVGLDGFRKSMELYGKFMDSVFHYIRGISDQSDFDTIKEELQNNYLEFLGKVQESVGKALIKVLPDDEGIKEDLDWLLNLGEKFLKGGRKGALKELSGLMLKKAAGSLGLLMDIGTGGMKGIKLSIPVDWVYMSMYIVHLKKATNMLSALISGSDPPLFPPEEMFMRT
jgi:hypothetical protein